jgi:hypothetical protein
VIPLQIVLATLLGWLDREQRDVIAFLREENRALKTQLGRRRLRLHDEQRRRLALLGQRLGRGLLREVATLVTPDTILRWHRELVALKWPYARLRQGRPGVRQEIRRLVVRMATDNPQWVHAHSGRAEERGASCGALDDRKYPQGRRPPTTR